MLHRIIAVFVFTLFYLSCTPVNAKVAEGWTQTGITSYYHKSLNGNKTASGERYKHWSGMTAAHRTLPFGTIVQVTNKTTGDVIKVKINDRGPFVGKRVLDLSGKAATSLGIMKQGLCKVEIKVLSVPPKKGMKKRLNPIETIKPKQPFENNRFDAIEDLIANNFKH